MDTIRQQLLASSVIEVNLARVLFNVTVAAVLALALRIVYVRFGTALSNRKQFANNFLLLACTTTLIITVVKSSLALSLGLVGALSIIRFRSAIKEPEELAYLFLTIAIGLGLGADQLPITVAVFVLILGLIALNGYWNRTKQNQNLLLTVGSYQGTQTQLDKIIAVLHASCAAVNLRRFDDRPDMLEAAFNVEFEDYEQLEKSTSQLRSLDHTLQISFIDNRGVL